MWDFSHCDSPMASQSWLYFDTDRVIEEVKRVLKSDGLLVTSHLICSPAKTLLHKHQRNLC
jgi:hypothetical protein